ncbi:MAG: hypothetical protein PHU21_06480, partial [Elusimicrobia bacterium]|nr:hypothetical protein [Elusimicrobiota bacterium]
MVLISLALLCAGLPAPLQAAQVQARAIVRPVGFNAVWAGLRAPSVTLSAAPSLLAPSLSPAVLTRIPLVAVQPAAAPAAPVLAGLEQWYSKSSEKSAPDAPALASLWDGSSLKAPAAADDAVSPVLEASEAPALAKAAPETSGSFEAAPGSIFDWKPVAQSPGHGWALADRIVRWALGRPGGHFQQGYEMSGAPRREDAQVFFYGERHSDKDLIQENMRRIASDIRPDRGALVLDEGYLGPRLHGSEAVAYLEKKGLDPAWLGSMADFGVGLELAGWDERGIYEKSKHPLP